MCFRTFNTVSTCIELDDRAFYFETLFLLYLHNALCCECVTYVHFVDCILFRCFFALNTM